MVTLCALFCLNLCACGNNKANYENTIRGLVSEKESLLEEYNNSMAEYDQIVEEMTAEANERETMLRKYEEVIPDLDAFMAFKDEYIVVLQYIMDENYDGAIQALEQRKEEAYRADLASRGVEEVTITLDNWQEYFEITDFVSTWKNSFGEVDSMQYGYSLSLKNEYVSKVDDADVAFEYYFSEPCYADIEYNLETKEIVVGEAYTEEQIKDKKMPVLGMHALEEHSGTNSFNSGNIEKGAGYKVMNYEYAGAPLTITDNVATWCSAFYQNAEIIRIQGTLTIIK